MNDLLQELVRPYVGESYDNLPAEVQEKVLRYFTPEAWNASSLTGRANFFRRHDEKVNADRAELAQIISLHAYWFKLQSEILTAERAIADLRIRVAGNANQGGPEHATLCTLQVQLVALLERWHNPDDSTATAQLAAELADLGKVPTVVDISGAIRFLSENTSVTWTESHLLSLVASSDIRLYGLVSPWAPMEIVEWRADLMLRALPYLRPGRPIFVELSPSCVRDIWVSGQTSSPIQVLKDSFSVDRNDDIFLQTAACILRTDIRLPVPSLLQILQKWEASRAPIVPLLPSSSAASTAQLAPAEPPFQEHSTCAFELPVGAERSISTDEGNASGLKLREQQILAIVAAITRLGFPPMCIPKGGKKKVEAECRNANGHGALFGGGPDPFKAAWQEAVNQKRVRTAGHTGYASR